jgi:hypothetical protein
VNATALTACRTTLQSGQIGVEVTCPSADLAWLEEFLSPAFCARASGGDVHYGVEAVVDEGRFDAYLAARPAGPLPEAAAFVLDQRVLTTVSWRDPSTGRTAFFDPAHRVVYLTHADTPGVTIVARTGGRLFRGALMRVVREVAMTRAWTPGSLVLHASAFATARGAVIVAGPKRAGKTSLLLYALHGGAAFISNDRVVLVSGGESFVAHGMPSITSLRHSTLALFPRLAAALDERRYRAHLTIAEAEASAAPPDGDGAISPSQLCRAMDARMDAAVPAAAVLLPRVDLSRLGLEILPLDPSAARDRFDDVLFASANRGGTSDVFGIAGGERVVDVSSARALWGRAVNTVPVFECVIGRGAFDEPAAATVLAIAGPRVDVRASR